MVLGAVPEVYPPNIASNTVALDPRADDEASALVITRVVVDTDVTSDDQMLSSLPLKESQAVAPPTPRAMTRPTSLTLTTLAERRPP